MTALTDLPLMSRTLMISLFAAHAELVWSQHNDKRDAPVDVTSLSKSALRSWPHTLRAGELADQVAEDVRIFLDYCGGELEFTILGAVGAGGGWRSALARWRRSSE